MKLQSLNCNHCGAQLQVAESANFVTCSHCDAQLAIHRNDSALYTETIKQLAEQTTEIAEHVAQLAYENKLERIDEEWEEERAGYMSYDDRGKEAPPAIQIVGGVIAMVVGAVICFFVEWPFGMFGLAFVAIGGIGAVAGGIKQQGHTRGYQAYLRRRRQIKQADFLPRARRK